MEETTEINLKLIYDSMDKWKDSYYKRLFDLTVKDAIAMMFESLNYEGWSFHD